MAGLHFIYMQKSDLILINSRIIYNENLIWQKSGCFHVLQNKLALSKSLRHTCYFVYRSAKMFFILKVYFSLLFFQSLGFVLLSAGQFYHSFSVMDWSPESWLRFSHASSLMYSVIYISTPLWFAQYLIVEHRASFRRTSATHVATRAPVGGKEEYPSLSASYLRLFLWLILHVQEGATGRLN